MKGKTEAEAKDGSDTEDGEIIAEDFYVCPSPAEDLIFELYLFNHTYHPKFCEVFRFKAMSTSKEVEEEMWWWCCGGVAVVVVLWFWSCRAAVVVLLRWWFSGGVVVVMVDGSQLHEKNRHKHKQLEAATRNPRQKRGCCQEFLPLCGFSSNEEFLSLCGFSSNEVRNFCGCLKRGCHRESSPETRSLSETVVTISIVAMFHSDIKVTIEDNIITLWNNNREGLAHVPESESTIFYEAIVSSSEFRIDKARGYERSQQ
nr:hypothetical protein [Tanacetum cinerariifolium]